VRDARAEDSILLFDEKLPYDTIHLFTAHEN
jgi:hypothetical protein